ncbi:hypothetical protein JCM19296_329 [Nonlabens ulvanivorans]|uniref:Uncharacterized protein n=1 Tax=Nonlabens ulvanivorans TaxID=906888 RepID=A0A081D755_NONUL|nr:hypothetical protein [Nonlabens ulvanivorans]GAK74751.1 hypothetical protein JCM19296_329 [Nonlabens ulvanivorans]
MKTTIRLLCFLIIASIVLVSCEKDEYLKDSTISVPFPFEVTKMSKEEIINLLVIEICLQP